MHGVICRGAALLVLLAGIVLLPRRLASAPAPIGVVDLHVDLSYQVNFKGRPFATGSGQYDVRWLRQGGVRGVVWPLYVPRDASPRGPLMEHLEDSHLKMTQHISSSGAYSPDLCTGDLQLPGVQFAFEGAEPVGWDFASVQRWHARGLRLYGLVHSYDNALASSSGAGFSPRDYGLSRRGAELLRRVHAVGGMVDVSHASDEAFADIANQALAAGRPIIATHSNARSVARHPRNLTDAQLRTIARSGGVVGINFHSPFLRLGAGVARLDDVVRHIEHAVSVAGIDHVAIGSDFEGGITPPKALADVRGFPRLAQALRLRGMKDREIARIFHGNALRVLCARRAP
jgi:membrane dipeptidase